MIEHDVQDSSREAYHTSQLFQQLLRNRILKYLGEHPGSTNREMEEGLEIRGTSLTSAVHFLRATDEVVLDITENKLNGRRKCAISGRNVMTWRRTYRPAQPFGKLKLIQVAHNDALNLASAIIKKHLNAKGIGLDGNYGPTLTAMLDEIAGAKITPPIPKQPRERKEPKERKKRTRRKAPKEVPPGTQLALVPR